MKLHQLRTEFNYPGRFPGVMAGVGAVVSGVGYGVRGVERGSRSVEATRDVQANGIAGGRTIRVRVWRPADPYGITVSTRLNSAALSNGGNRTVRH